MLAAASSISAYTLVHGHTPWSLWVNLNETSECDTIGVTIGLQSNFCDALLEGWTSVLRIARPPTLDALDAWIAREPEPRPSRPEAVRRLLAVALEK